MQVQDSSYKPFAIMVLLPHTVHIIPIQTRSRVYVLAGNLSVYIVQILKNLSICSYFSSLMKCNYNFSFKHENSSVERHTYVF